MPSAPHSRVNPPFRADHVGSLLRSPELSEARAGKTGRISAGSLAAIEKRYVREAVAKQAAIGFCCSPMRDFNAISCTSTSCCRLKVPYSRNRPRA